MSTSWSGHPAMSALNFQVIVFAIHFCPDLSIINPYPRLNLMQRQNEDLVPVCKCLHLQEACRCLRRLRVLPLLSEKVQLRQDLRLFLEKSLWQCTPSLTRKESQCRTG